MSKLDWKSWLRIAFGVFFALAVLCCLAGIMLSGPVIVRTTPLELERNVSAERLQATVQRLCSDFHPRDYRSPDKLEQAAGWIAEEFRAAGLEVELQPYELREGRFLNVIGLQRGSHPELPVVIVGAHYDAYGGFPGANDNASGVAVLLELVRSLPAGQSQADRYFVAFSTEEPPFFSTEDMGSFRFARLLQERETKIDLMIALDVVGYYSDEENSQGFPIRGLGLLYPDTADFVAVVGDLGSGPWIAKIKRAMLSTGALPVYSFRAPTFIPGVDWSDHISFRRLGMPGVMVTDTAFARYEHYHTRNDTPEKLDYLRMAQLVHALHGVLWEDPSRVE